MVTNCKATHRKWTCCKLYHTMLMSCGVIMKVGWMDKVVASFWPYLNVTVVENLFSSVNTANRPHISLIEIQSIASLITLTVSIGLIVFYYVYFPKKVVRRTNIGLSHQLPVSNGQVISNSAHDISSLIRNVLLSKSIMTPCDIASRWHHMTPLWMNSLSLWPSCDEALLTTASSATFNVYLLINLLT